MANAVIRAGGRQFRVAEGDVLKLNKLAGNPGDKVEFGEVLVLGGDTPKFGKPTVKGAKVTAEIVRQGRGEKIVVFKFRRRKKHRRKQGHRQDFTEVKITGIQS
jgi:large subunit ribosomal protein L21